MKLLFKWIVCFLALLVAAYVFPAQVSSSGMLALAAAAVVLWLLNLFVKPLLQLICLPATLLTFGLFSFVANAWMVGLTDAMLPMVQIDGFWIRLFVAILISLGNAAIMAVRARGLK